jgi:hypothetical protein
MHTHSLEDATFEIHIRLEIPNNEGEFLERLKMRLQLNVSSIIEIR